MDVSYILKDLIVFIFIIIISFFVFLDYHKKNLKDIEIKNSVIEYYKRKR